MNKRIMSLALALMMVLGTFTTVFAADTSVLPEEITADWAGQFLNEKDILKGYEGTDNLGLEDNLTKRDALVLVARLLGEEDEMNATEEEASFVDLTENPYYNRVIAWGEVKGLAQGTPEKEFEGEKDVTAGQYSAFVLRALGYEVKGPEAWGEMIKLAETKGLFEDMETPERDSTLTRGEVAVMTFNALGAKMNGEDKTLAEHLGIEIPAPAKPSELKVEVKDTENLAEVKVEYSNMDLVNKSLAKDVKNYRFTGGANKEKLEIQSAEIDGNDVILTLNTSKEGREALLKGREYELTIRNIDRAVNNKYKFTAKDDQVPTVEKVEVLGEYGIKVRVSEPLKNVDERNFRIDNERVIMIVEQYGRDIILSPYYNEKFPEDAKTLSIEGLEDFSGHKSSKYVTDIKVEKDEIAPKVVKSEITGNKLTVTFDKDVYHKSVKGYENRRALGNVSYTEGRVRDIIYTLQDADATDVRGHKYARKVKPNVVVYEFDRVLPRNVEIDIEGVANHSNIKMEKEVLKPELVIDNSAPEIVAPLTFVNARNQELTLEFDKDLNVKQFDKNGVMEEKDIKEFFTLYKREVSRYGEKLVKDEGSAVKSVELVDGYKVKVTFDKLEANNRNKDNNYILEVRNFEDNTVLKNRMERTYVDFEYDTAKGSNFELESAEIRKDGRYNTEIELRFTKPVDKESAKDAKNYFFGKNKDLSQLRGEAIVERDGRIVTLAIPMAKEDLVEDYDYVEILPRLKSLDGARLGEVRRFNFKEGLVDGIKVELDEGKVAVITYDMNNNLYVIDANKSSTVKITTDLDAEIKVTNVDENGKVIIDAKKAHVVLATDNNLGEVEVINLGDDSLEIAKETTVAKLIISTDKVVKVFGNVNKLEITSTVDKAEVKVSTKANSKAETVKLDKNESAEVTVGEDGKVTVDKDEDSVEEAKKIAEAEKALEELEAKVEVGETILKEERDLVLAKINLIKDGDIKEALTKRLNEIKVEEDKEEELEVESVTADTEKVTVTYNRELTKEETAKAPTADGVTFEDVEVAGKVYTYKVKTLPEATKDEQKIEVKVEGYTGDKVEIIIPAQVAKKVEFEIEPTEVTIPTEDAEPATATITVTKVLDEKGKEIKGYDTSELVFVKDEANTDANITVEGTTITVKQGATAVDSLKITVKDLAGEATLKVE